MPRHATPHPDLAGYVLGTLEAREAAAFDEHLATCSTCRAEVAELSSLPDLLRRADAAVEPPADLGPRTLAAIDAATAPPPRRPARGRGHHRRRLAAVSAAVAAVLVAAVAAAAVIARGDDSPNGDSFTAELASVVSDSDAGGTAQLQRTPQGVVVDLEVWGLPTGGVHYECWYVDAGDGTTRVSAGTFVTTEDGTAKVRMITAADPVRFPRIVVTREPDDGNPNPGEPVLTSS